MDQISEWCPHSAVWRDCKDSACREIGNLAEAQLKDIKEERALSYLAKKAAEERGESKGDLEERKTAGEIELEQQLVNAWENEEKGRTDSGNRHGLPYDHPTVRAMHQFGALSERQAKIGRILLDLPPGGKKQSIWGQIARTIGCCSRTVKREWERINTRLSEKKHVYYPPGSIVVIKTRGQRVLQYWLTHEVRFRNWRFAWRELINDRALIRRLLRQGRPVINWPKISPRESPMSRLYGALIREFGNEFKDPLNKLPDGAQWPPPEFADDWQFNLQKAKKLLSKRYGGESWTTSQVSHMLGKRSVLCKGCGTLILRGFRIGGHLITRRAKHCDAACKMKGRRSPYPA